jgi:antitoxin component YwqK of YwqJK toxin-antitoxin module
VPTISTGLFLTLLATCSALAAYRLVWRRRYGTSNAFDEHLVVLRGQVEGPGQRGTPVLRAAPAGEILERRHFQLRRGRGAPVEIDPTGALLLLRARTIRVGDQVTVHGVPSSVVRDETLYRQSGLETGVAALRIAAGTWPELRWLNVVMACTGILALLWVASAARVARPAAPTDVVQCPTGTRAAGGRPPLSDFEWCEVKRLAGPTGVQDAEKHGPFVAWWNVSLKRQQGLYDRGRPHGEWLTWHPDQKIAAVAHYFRGRLVGEWKSFWKNGKLQERREYTATEQRHGQWLSFDEGGRLLLVRSYTWGKPHGEWVAWYPSGRIHYRQWFKDGLRHGPWRRWHEEGWLLESGAYAENRKHGTWSAWSAPGRLARQGEYEGDGRSGGWRFWHEDGTLRARGRFLCGKRHGIWTFWHPNGPIEARGRYGCDESEGPVVSLQVTQVFECGAGCGVKKGRWRRWAGPDDTL